MQQCRSQGPAGTTPAFFRDAHFERVVENVAGTREALLG